MRERAALAALALAAVVAWALVPTYPDYDAYHHLVWGRDLVHGLTPGFEDPFAPTPHPLYLGLAAVLSLAGEHADRLLVLVTVLSLVALVAAAFALGRSLFGTAAAYLGACFVGSSFAFLLYAVRAFVDVPFLALVVWAAALEARRARRGAAPMALLAAAGLLRPEAWVLAGLYWLWCLPSGPSPNVPQEMPGADHRLAASSDARCARGTPSVLRPCQPAPASRHFLRNVQRRPTNRSIRERAGLLALAAAAPVLWCLVDLAVTGDPLFSLTNTQALSDSLERERGLAHVPSLFVTFLADLARPPVALAGVIGLVLALRRLGPRRLAIPLALLGAGALTFVAIGVAGLSLIPRYLTVPAVALCVLAGYAVMGFATLEPGPLRTRWRTGAAGALVVGVAFLVVKAGSFGALRSELRFIDRTHDEVSALVAQPEVRAGLRCGALTFPTYRLVPDARWLLHAGAGTVRTRAGRDGTVRPPGAVAVYITGDEKFDRRFGRADGVSRATNRPIRPAAGVPARRHGPFAVYVVCRARPR
ncbi:MAG: hypothetical protein QOI64_941 [Solirubrobacteraceae bacterium]|nr:hypothetical protein [Solirubrobacteraceae bacterium]